MAVTTFEDMVRRTTLNGDGCMEWVGRTSYGYGRVWYGGSGKQAHRVSYELAVGKIRDGLVIDHLCRNKACINPWHLEATTQAINVRRGDSGGSTLEDGRFKCRRCGCEDAKISRAGRGHMGVEMQCRSCVRVAAAARYERDREKIIARSMARYVANRDSINAKRRADAAAKRAAK